MLTVALLVAVAASVYSKVAGLVPDEYAAVEPVGFAFIVACPGYVTVQYVVRNERQPLTIEVTKGAANRPSSRTWWQ